MNVSNVIYLATFATVSAYLIHAVSSLSYNTLDDTIPYKRLFWIDKKATLDGKLPGFGTGKGRDGLFGDSTTYHVSASSVPLIVDCFLTECLKGFTSCGKACLMTNEELPCIAACNQERTGCPLRCFGRYDLDSPGRMV